MSIIVNVAYNQRTSHNLVNLFLYPYTHRLNHTLGEFVYKIFRLVEYLDQNLSVFIKHLIFGNSF